MIHQIFRNIALASVVVCLCVLPGANVKLPASTLSLILGLAYAGFGCWAVSRLLEWRPVRPHEKSVWGIAALICVYGWVVTCFPSAMVVQATGAILELDEHGWLAFGTVDQGISTQAMISICSGLMLLVMAADFASEHSGRYALALGITMAGSITAIAGLWLQTADLRMLWEVKHVPTSVFGLFWYHGNAAAFLNLAWPAGVWLGMLLLRRDRRGMLQQLALAFLVVAVMLQIVAVFVNVSKMGHVILILELLLLVGAGLAVWRPQLATLPFSKKRLLLLVVIGVGLLVAGAWLSGAGAGLERWNVFAARRFDDPARRHAAMMAIKIGMDRGWAGSGPGTFEWVSPHYSAEDPLLQEGRWRHAHCDYAEFFAEWGWPGAFIFLLSVIWLGTRLKGALWQALANGLPGGMSFQRRMGLICFSVALMSALVHAVVDFPLQIDAIRGLFATMVGATLAMTTSSARGYGSKRSARS